MPEQQDFEQIEKYRIVRRLGTGAFGRVYLGQHPLLNRQVAIKVFLGNVDIDRERDQFLREALVLDQLKHPNILPLIDAGVEERAREKDIAYVITEYAPNGSLRDRLEASRFNRLPLEETLLILSQVGAGLSFAHEQGFVHRDLKPENILFNAEGEAVLADFGIAVVLASGTKWGDEAGTPAYMAPEQLQGAVSRKSDQYALGCIAYEMLTGQRPFKGPTRDAFLYQQMNTRPRSPRRLNPSIPHTVEEAILRAMAKERDDRYPDISLFLAALKSRPRERLISPFTSSTRRYTSSHNVSAVRYTSPYPVRRRGARRRNPPPDLELGREQDDLVPRRRRGDAFPLGVARPRHVSSPLRVSHAPRWHQQQQAPQSQDTEWLQRNWLLGLEIWGSAFLLIGALLGYIYVLTGWGSLVLASLVFTAGVFAIGIGFVLAYRRCAQKREWGWIVVMTLALVLPLVLGIIIGRSYGLVGGISAGALLIALVINVYGRTQM